MGLDSVDNYALGLAHSDIKIFKKIREALHPKDILNINLETLKENKSIKTNEIVAIFKELRYYEEQLNISV